MTGARHSTDDGPRRGASPPARSNAPPTRTRPGRRSPDSSRRTPGSPTQLTSDPLLADAVVAVSVASHSLLAVLERDPTALHGPGRLDAPRTTATRRLRRRGQRVALRPTIPRPHSAAGSTARSCASPAATCSASPISRPSASELAAVAQACLDVALAIAAPTIPMAVIGMGKLGGAELNYASDVDVLFVHDGDSTEAERAARAVLRAMTEPTRRRHRVPHRRRPATRRPFGTAEPHARLRTRRTGRGGRRPGSSRRSSRPGRSRATSTLGAAFTARPSRSSGPTCSIRPRCTKCAR